MKPIETESIALQFLSWLRDLKPTPITASRNVTVSDFGRLILLNGSSAIDLTLVTLTRSGSFKVGLMSNYTESGVVCPTGTFDLQSRTEFGSNTKLYFDSVVGVNLETPVPKLIEFYYNHDLNKWFYNILTKDSLYTGNAETAAGTTVDGNTLLRRNRVGGIDFNYGFICYDTKLELNDPANNYVQMSCYDGERSLQIACVDSVLTWDLSVDSGGAATSIAFSSRVKSGGFNFVIVDAPETKYANDVAAASGGVAVGEIYQTSANKFRARMS